MSFHKGINTGGGGICNTGTYLKQCAQKEYENYKFRLYDCFPQVCLVLTPFLLFAKYIPVTESRQGQARGPQHTAAHRQCSRLPCLCLGQAEGQANLLQGSVLGAAFLSYQSS